MNLEIETLELLTALQRASKEALDVVQATTDVAGTSAASVGHNELRAAAQDAHIICKNLIIRLGGEPIYPAPYPKDGDTVLSEETGAVRSIQSLIESEKREGETDAVVLDRLKREFGYLEAKLAGSEATTAQKERHTYLSENKRGLLP